MLRPLRGLGCGHPSRTGKIIHVRPGIHPKLAAAISRCIRRDPGERFAAVKDFTKAIVAIESEDAA